MERVASAIEGGDLQSSHLLGGTFATIPNVSGGDLNNLHAGGVYNTTFYTNQPDTVISSGGYSVTLVLNYGGSECVQLLFNIINGDCYRRIYVNQAWGNWYHWE